MFDDDLMDWMAGLKECRVRVHARLSPAHHAFARQLVRGLALVQMDRQLYGLASTLTPPQMRSLDALHVAAALTLGQDLAEFITYDARMAQAAQAHGLLTAGPS